MEDDIVRQREVQLIQHFVCVLKSRFPGVLKVADVGCGNGFTLAALAPQFSADAFLGFETLGELDGAVDGHPAHELGVEEVPRFSPDLPDALVLLPPMGRSRVSAVGEERPPRGCQQRDSLPSI